MRDIITFFLGLVVLFTALIGGAIGLLIYINEQHAQSRERVEPKK